MDKKLYILNDDEDAGQSGLIIYDFFNAVEQKTKTVDILKFINSTNTQVIDR